MIRLGTNQPGLFRNTNASTMTPVPRAENTLSAATFAESLRRAKLRLLRMRFESNTGHLGGSLSCLDALMALHHLVLRSDDRFVLSKGHAASAHYVTLWSLGQLA